MKNYTQKQEEIPREESRRDSRETRGVAKKSRALAYLCLVSTVLIGASGTFASDFEDKGLVSVVDSGAATAPDSAPSTAPVVETVEEDVVSEQQSFLNRISQELDISKTEYYQISRNIKETRNRIENLKEEMSELQNQVVYFDNEIATTQQKLFTVIRQVVRAENEIKILYEEIDLKETALEYQKNLLKDYIKELYIYGDTYFEVDATGEIDAFKLLLADGNTGDVLKEIKYLGILEETGDRLVDRLVEIVDELEAAQEEIEVKRVALAKLENQLQEKKSHLETQKAAKENMLIVTKSQDKIYRELLVQSMEEQQEALAEIQAFQETLAFVEQKIVEEGDSFDISKYEDMVGQRFMTIYEFHKLPASGEGFIWPVMPERGLSAYFHDPSYRGVFGVQHSAVDVRVGQGTPVFAAADGVVYKAADNDYGYSYVTVVHHDGLTTNYGHISNIMVEEGQVIPQGSVLGLSGGMPGTKGAGYMTTGPHLHFEVLQNGAYVDPLRFLPLEVLDADAIETLPDSYMDDWELAILSSDLLE